MPIITERGGTFEASMVEAAHCLVALKRSGMTEAFEDRLQPLPLRTGQSAGAGSKALVDETVPTAGRVWTGGHQSHGHEGTASREIPALPHHETQSS